MITILLIFSVSSALAGDVLEFDTDQGKSPNIIQINEEIYAIAYSGEDEVGLIKTVEIENNGDISDTFIDSYEFDSNRGITPDIIHIFGEVYAIAYTGENDAGYLKTLLVDSNGFISESPEMYQNQFVFDSNMGKDPDIIHITENIYAIAYGDEGILRTIQISNNGQISNIISVDMRLDFAPIGKTPNIIKVTDNIFAIAYSECIGPHSYGVLKTIEILDNGRINSIINSYTFDNKECLNPNIINIYDNLFAIAYTGNGGKGQLLTLGIESDGTINPIISILECDNKRCYNPDIYPVIKDIYTVAFTDQRGSNNNGFIKTVKISSEGLIQGWIDGFEFDSIQGNTPDLIKTGEIISPTPESYADIDNKIITIISIAYSGQDDDGFIKTIEIDSEGIIGPEVIEIVTKDIDHDGNLEIAADKDQDPTNGYETFIDPDESSKAIVTIDGDADLFLDHFIEIDDDLLPDVYWDPDNDILVVITIEDVDYDGTLEWVYDSDGDGDLDSYYDPDDRQIHPYILFILDINIIGSGQVIKNPDKKYYLKDSVVQLEAIADPGWNFNQWSGDLTGNTNLTSITMDNNKFIIAEFNENPPVEYTLTINIAGSGTVLREPDLPTYTEDTIVTLTPVADTGWSFCSWSGADAGDLVDNGDGSWDILIDSDKILDAQFDLDGPFSVSVSYSGSGSGSVVLDPVGPYFYGDVVTLWANASSDSEFISWSGDLSGNNSPESIFMDSDKNVDAEFSLLPVYYDLIISSVGNGTTNPSVGTYSFLEGSLVNLEAFADTGWSFENWSGDISSSNNQTSILMDSNKSVTANFTKDPVYYTLSIIINGNGTTNPSEGNYSYLENSVITISANEESCWSFTNYSGDTFSTDRTINITLTNDMQIIANFVKDSYALTITSIGNGSTSPVLGTHIFDCGSIVDLEAIASFGWIFNSWSGDISTSNNQTSILIDNDKNVCANFDRFEYNLTITTIGNGSGLVEVSSLGPYYYGDVVTLWANVSVGSHFVGWSGDLSGSVNPESLTVVGNMVVDASFILEEYTIDFNIVGSGYATKTPNKTTYNFGDIVEIEAFASSDWSFVEWSGDYSGSINPDNILVVGDMTITVTFIQDLPDTYTLTINKIGSGNGIVEFTPLGPYNAGEVVTLWANASVGSSFDGWTGNLSGTNSPEVLVMDSNKTVNAQFVLNPTITYNLTIDIIGSGTTNPSPGTYSFVADSLVNIEAISDSDWNFSHWNGEFNSTQNNTSIIINSDKIITANFVETPVYILKISINGNGTTNPIAGNHSYLAETIVSLEAIAESKWIFDNWSGDINTTENQTTILINNNKNITANFEEDPSGGSDDGDSDDGSSNGNDGGNEGGNPSIIPTTPILPPATILPDNESPIANASAGEPYYGFIDEEITFNASFSYDPDGNITDWLWNFSDGTNVSGEIVTHIFSEPGIYIVNLTVIDEVGAEGYCDVIVDIKQASRPPSIPVLNGPGQGNISTVYNFTFISYDEDGDNLKYIIDWGDGTNKTKSGLVSNGTIFKANHSWNKEGIYNISVSVIDDFEKVTQKIFTIQINSEEKENINPKNKKNNNLLILLFIILLALVSLLLLLALKDRKKKDKAEKIENKEEKKDRPKKNNSKSKTNKTKKSNNKSKKASSKANSTKKTSNNTKKKSKSSKKSNSKKKSTRKSSSKNKK
jgi:hypothetical protein